MNMYTFAVDIMGRGSWTTVGLGWHITFSCNRDNLVTTGKFIIK